MNDLHKKEKIMKIFSILLLLLDLILTILFETLDILYFNPDYGNATKYLVKVINYTIS